MSDTPRSDAAIGQYPHGNAVELECRQLERELNDALRWKSEHLAVESWWAKIDAHVRKSPDCALGRSVAEVALEFLEERDRLKAKLKLEKPNPFPDGTDASDLWNMREDAYLAEIAALRQRLTIVKSAAEASVDRAHTQGVMDSILRQEIGRLKDEVAELIKDRERLDWLVSKIAYQPAADGMRWATLNWCIEADSLSPATIHDAIDAAMEAKP